MRASRGTGDGRAGRSGRVWGRVAPSGSPMKRQQSVRRVRMRRAENTPQVDARCRTRVCYRSGAMASLIEATTTTAMMTLMMIEDEDDDECKRAVCGV